METRKAKARIIILPEIYIPKKFLKECIAKIELCSTIQYSTASLLSEALVVWIHASHDSGAISVEGFGHKHCPPYMGSIPLIKRLHVARSKIALQHFPLKG